MIEGECLRRVAFHLRCGNKIIYLIHHFHLVELLGQRVTLYIFAYISEPARFTFIYEGDV